MNKAKQLDFSGQDIFIGLDTHLKTWKVTIIVGDTSFKTYMQDPDIGVLSKFLQKNLPGGNYYSAYEASFSGFSIHRKLLKSGIKNIVVNPADIPTTDKERKQKEDKRDSRKIAKQLSNGSLVPIYIPEVETEGDRNLIRYRKSLAKDSARAKNRIKSLLYYHGIKIPAQFDENRYWSKKLINWIEELEMPTPSAKLVLEKRLNWLKIHREEILSTNRAIRQLSKKQVYKTNVNLLISVPGVGLLTAMILLTEVGDIKRFKNTDKLNAYLGLIPTTNSSGQKDKTGNITSRTNKLLRSTIIESAWVAIRNDAALMLAFQKLIKRMESQNAIIRIAKKLVNRIVYVLREQKPYVSNIVK
ncbi:MAG: IS110 family transposase [Bacteroidales bacterium]|nr:IS110 family transposase [Bacteroidales bacterium]MCF8344755.1 IS110 family transposase [Bacteroidales bacterium]MCF8352353.1 IS110 family transposase [Bacteroidales bacterium]MCF8377878.1 IS110 family transposase [Bacteroidales bacterium]